MHEHGAPVTQVCTQYRISRKIFSKWYGRYRGGGKGIQRAHGPLLSSRPSLASASRHKLIPVGTPQQTGKVERSHRNLDEECRNSRTFRKPRPRAFAIKRWVTFYNSQRPHSALHWHTPLQTRRSFQEYQRVTHGSNQYTFRNWAAREPLSFKGRHIGVFIRAPALQLRHRGRLSGSNSKGE